MPTNASLTQFAYGTEKKFVRLECPVSFGTSGAPTLLQWNPSNAAGAGSYSAAPTSASTTGTGSPFGARGISSIVRNSAGNFTVTLQGQFQRLLQAQATFLDGASTNAGLNPANGSYPPAAPIMFVDWDNTNVAESPGVINVIFNGLGTSAGGVVDGVSNLLGAITGVVASGAGTAGGIAAAPVLTIASGNTPSWGTVGTANVLTFTTSPTAFAAGALVGMQLSSGTGQKSVVTDNTAITTGGGGTISVAVTSTLPSGTTSITITPLVSTLTSTTLSSVANATTQIGSAAAGTGTLTATDPAQYETVVIEFFFDDSSA